MATQKLLHYFINYEVMAITSYPLREFVHNRDVADQITKWALKLMGNNIRYVPRTAIKSQALADFIAEWTKV